MFEEAVSLLSIWASMNTWLTPTVLFLLLNLMIATIALTSSAFSSHHHHHQQQQQPQIQTSVLQRLKSLNFYPHIHSPQQTPPLPPPATAAAELSNTGTGKYSHTEVGTGTRTGNSIKFKGEFGCWEVPKYPKSNISGTYKLRIIAAEPVPKVETHLSPTEEEEEGPTLDEVYSLIVQKGKNSAAQYGRQNSDTNPAGGDVPLPLPRNTKKSASDKSTFGHFEAIDETDDNAASPFVVAPPVEEEAAEFAGGGDVGVDARADDFINRFREQLKLQKVESIVRYTRK